MWGAGGVLYGATQSGGASGAGTVFRINPDGTGFRVLYQCSNSVDYSTLTGVTGSLLSGLDEALYSVDNGGALYRLQADGTGVAAPYVFGDGFGAILNGPPLQGPDGMLYGTTHLGAGTHSGGVWAVNPDGTGFTNLHFFGESTAPQDGIWPTTRLTWGRDGALYGATGGGWVSNGTLFKINPDGTGFVTLYDFAWLQGNWPASLDGRNPNSALLLGIDGALYGTTSAGGEENSGTIFRLDPVQQTCTVLYSFSGGGNQTPLVQGLDGALYGGATMWPTSGVFRLTLPLFSNSQPPAFRPTITPVTGLPGGGVTVRLTGLAGCYRIDGSTDLVNWSPASGTLTNVAGFILWTDPAATNYTHRFYRAAWVP